MAVDTNAPTRRVRKGWRNGNAPEMVTLTFPKSFIESVAYGLQMEGATTFLFQGVRPQFSDLADILEAALKSRTGGSHDAGD